MRWRDLWYIATGMILMLLILMIQQELNRPTFTEVLLEVKAEIDCESCEERLAICLSFTIEEEQNVDKKRK